MNVPKNYLQMIPADIVARLYVIYPREEVDAWIEAGYIASTKRAGAEKSRSDQHLVSA